MKMIAPGNYMYSWKVDDLFEAFQTRFKARQV